MGQSPSLISNDIIPRCNIALVFMVFPDRTGKFDLEVTTFQMAVLFCWENRREDKISLENLRLATGNTNSLSLAHVLPISLSDCRAARR